jgi:hypothetical protein
VGSGKWEVGSGKWEVGSYFRMAMTGGILGLINTGVRFRKAEPAKRQTDDIGID